MASEQIYPYASQQGLAIPLEVVRPVSLVVLHFLASTAADKIIPAAFAGTCWVYATEDCILRFSATDLPGTLVEGTAYADATLIPADTPFSIFFPATGEVSLVGIGTAGKLYINKVVQWAATNQPLQTTVG